MTIVTEVLTCHNFLYETDGAISVQLNQRTRNTDIFIQTLCLSVSLKLHSLESMVWADMSHKVFTFDN